MSAWFRIEVEDGLAVVDDQELREGDVEYLRASEGDALDVVSDSQVVVSVTLAEKPEQTRIA
jgi:hypothetical protein